MANNTHEVAQRAAPESRIVYVDNDPIVQITARLDRWQPGGPTPDTDDSGITAYGALGRKS